MLTSRLQSAGVSILEEDLKHRDPNRNQQHQFTDQIMKSKVHSLLQTADPENQARIRAAQQVGASDWLRSLPTSAAKHLSDRYWKIAARLRLGLRVGRVPLPQVCPLCNTEIQNVGFHAF